jgi:hypothetical protein
MELKLFIDIGQNRLDYFIQEMNIFPKWSEYNFKELFSHLFIVEFEQRMYKKSDDVSIYRGTE